MTRALVLALVLVGACYRPASEAPCTVTCATTSDCTGGLACTNGLCTLANGSCVAADAGGPDAPLPDAPPGCFYGHAGGFFAGTLFCPGSGVILDSAFSSDTGSHCSPLPGLDAYCVVIGDTIMVMQTSVHVTGSRPLLLVASSIDIEGTIDVSTSRSSVATDGSGAGANALSCPLAVDGAAASFGATGGAGGSFGGNGGAGGTVGTTMGPSAGATAAKPTTLRGGCPGTAGGVLKISAGAAAAAAGDSGGAIYVLAHTTISFGPDAQVSAVGEGGGGAPLGGNGGGGGGSGGLIVLDAMSVSGSGFVLANGGGGGGGSSNSIVGYAGGEDANPSNPAAGGSGGGGGGGTGSVGGDAMTGGAATPTDINVLGAGGGGGGAGYVLTFVDTPPDTTNFSPQPQ